MMTVREAQPGDYAEAGKVTRAAYASLYGDGSSDEYLEMVEDVAGRADRTTILVAVDGERILGSLTLELTAKVNIERQIAPDEAHIRMLGVDPSAQRRGVGRALVQAAAEWARDAGKGKLTLGTMPQMTAAQRLYESLGFREGEEVEYAPGEWHLTYELVL